MKLFKLKKGEKLYIARLEIHILLFNNTNEDLIISLMGYGHVLP